MGSHNSASLGFGCASLFGLGSKSERRSVLEFAYDNGIRHFDVAPIYGLGQAESELGEFAAAHRDISIGTKFGLNLTAVGRFAGVVQPPVRKLLRARPGLNKAARKSGNTGTGGSLGKRLYTPGDYSPANARKSLHNSLKALRTNTIDFLFLHEPAGALGPHHQGLADVLDAEIQRGSIREWGPAGDLSMSDPDVAALARRATAMQFPYDLLSGVRGPEATAQQKTVTFGFLADALPGVTDILSRDQRLLAECSALLNADLKDARMVVHLLVRDAVTRNGADKVLYSSTSRRHLESVCAAARVPLPNERRVADAIRAAAVDDRIRA